MELDGLTNSKRKDEDSGKERRDREKDDREREE
jgi:hypothetical protein